MLLKSTQGYLFTMTKKKVLKQLFKNIKRTSIAKDVSVILQKTILVFQLWWKNKCFSSVFGSNRLRFSSYKFPASEKIFQNDGTAKYFLAKLTRCGYFDSFKFNKFKTLSSFFSAFNSLQQKKSFILLQFLNQQNPVARPLVQLCLSLF